MALQKPDTLESIKYSWTVRYSQYDILVARRRPNDTEGRLIGNCLKLAGVITILGCSWTHEVMDSPVLRDS